MNNEEKILSMLGALTTNVENLTTNVETLTINLENLTAEVKVIHSKVDRLEIKVDKLETKVDKLEARMLDAERQAERNFEFLLVEIERSDKRILSYFEDGALNPAGKRAKASFGLV